MDSAAIIGAAGAIAPRACALMAVTRCIAIMSPAPKSGAIKPGLGPAALKWSLLFQGGVRVAIRFS